MRAVKVPLRLKLFAVVVVAGWLAVGLTCAYRRGRIAGEMKQVLEQAKEAKGEVKKAVERGDGEFLYRDILKRARKSPPR